MYIVQLMLILNLLSLPHCNDITFSLWNNVKDFCSLHWKSLFVTGREFHYKMCSFITAWMASFYCLRAALRLHFICNGHFIIIN